MKKLIASTLSVVLVTAVVMAYAPQDETASVPRISQFDFAKLIKAGTLVIVDVRNADVYKAGHIPGAISIPLTEIPQHLKELPKDKTIVTYCG